LEKGDVVTIKDTLVLAEGLRGKRALILYETYTGFTFTVKVLEGKLKGKVFCLSKNYLQIEQWSVS